MSTTTLQPPPVPVHYSPPTVTNNISIIQPQSDFNNNKKNSTIDIDPPSVKRLSYLGRPQQQQSKKKRTSEQTNELALDYDSSTSSSDESEGGFSNRFSSQSCNSSNNPTEEHKFWQVHSSTTIIAPPMTDTDFSAAISMNYVNPRTLKKQPVARIPLAIQVRNILASTFDDVDEEIEREWESSRIQLRKSLITLPTNSLSSPSY